MSIIFYYSAISEEDSQLSRYGNSVVDPGFPNGGTSTSEFGTIFAENCMKMKEI